MAGMITVGASALRVAYAQMQTTSHNIANASTPGYSRQEVLVASAGSNFSGDGFLGRGVDIVTIQRRYDDYLAREVHATTAIGAGDAARSAALDRLDRVFADPENGIGAAYDDLSLGLADLANRPFDAAARTVATQRAGVLAGRVQYAQRDLDTLFSDSVQRIGVATDTINTSLVALAQLNNTIASASASSKPPNDLLDQRDALILKINEGMQANAYINQDGTASVYASTGDALVIGAKAAHVSLRYDPADATRLQVIVTSNGNALPMNESLLGGGEISGMLRFLNEDLRSAQWGLGQLAAGIASAYNGQQALGIDAAGNPGAAVFALGDVNVVPASANAGNASIAVTIADGRALAASDYTLGYDGSQYTLTRLADGLTRQFAGLPQAVDGLALSLGGGTVAAGDQFTLRGASVFASGFSLALTSSEQWAAGFAATATAGAGNQGTVSPVSFEVSSAGAGVAAPVTLTFTGANTFDVSGAGTGDPTGVSYVPGQPITFNGWRMTLAGTPAAGDTVTIGPPGDPLADNRNARALVDLADRPIVGRASASDLIAGLIANVGNRAQGAQAAARQSDLRLEGAKTALDEVSGVNLDEEAAHLLEYQQAYQAAAKVLATAQSMFDALMAATNG